MDNVAHLIELFKCLFIYLFYPVAYDPEGWQKLDGSQNSTVLHLFIYLSYEYSKRFVQPVVQAAAKCKQTSRRLVPRQRRSLEGTWLQTDRPTD